MPFDRAAWRRLGSGAYVGRLVAQLDGQLARLASVAPPRGAPASSRARSRAHRPGRLAPTWPEDGDAGAVEVELSPQIGDVSRPRWFISRSFVLKVCANPSFHIHYHPCPSPFCPPADNPSTQSSPLHFLRRSSPRTFDTSLQYAHPRYECLPPSPPCRPDLSLGARPSLHSLTCGAIESCLQPERIEHRFGHALIHHGVASNVCPTHPAHEPLS